MPALLSMADKLALFFCRLGWAGLFPRGPGTCGSLVAVLLAPWLFVPLPLAARCAVLVGLFVTGALAATRAERLLGASDPGEVVIDELVGVWLVLLPYADPSWWRLAAAFVLFRCFDIFKPWPVSASEHWLPAGYGIMIDDVVAAAMALAVMYAGDRLLL